MENEKKSCWYVSECLLFTHILHVSECLLFTHILHVSECLLVCLRMSLIHTHSAKEKHMLLILNFSTLTFITNARTTMPFARLHSQMVCKQSEPAKIPQHMFVQILVQVGGDTKMRTSRTTLRTPTPLVIRHCFLVYCART
jgi:hypothetical protein